MRNTSLDDYRARGVMVALVVAGLGGVAGRAGSVKPLPMDGQGHS
jgi:hypothetical protein